MKKVLLYSGGMDSWLIDKIWKPDVKLYVDMKTHYSQNEQLLLPPDVTVETLNLGKWERDDAIIPLRNLYLVMLATNYGDDICLGATAGDRVLDKSPEFAKMATDLLRYLYSPQWWNPEQRNINVNLSFKDKTKKELLQMYLDQGGDIMEAWSKSLSCYNPRITTPCMSCKPCFRKAVAFYQCMKERGMDLTLVFNKSNCHKLYEYMTREVIEDAKRGTTGRDHKEEQDMVEFYNWLEIQR